MKPTVIIYTSQTGHTRQYALMLAEELGIPVYSCEEAKNKLPAATPVIYLGWLHASQVKGYSQAAKHFEICSVCGVGLCDTGTLLMEVRKASSIPENIPLFTIQGGIDKSKLKGMDKLMISMLMKGLSSQKQRSEQDERMLELLSKDASYVSKENLVTIIQWYKEIN